MKICVDSNFILVEVFFYRSDKRNLSSRDDIILVIAVEKATTGLKKADRHDMTTKMSIEMMKVTEMDKFIMSHL